MAWRISDDATDHEADGVRKWYPYRWCTISQMISVLTQQRFDIVDSYDAVIQQRNSAQSGKGNDSGNVNKRNALNRVVPNRESSAKVLDPDDIFSDEQEAEQKPLTEPEPNAMAQGDAERVHRAKRAQRLYPAAQSDGGSNVPTKREELEVVCSSKEDVVGPHGQQRQQQQPQQRGQKGNALLTTASSSKHPGIMVEEMEKHMLNEEVARIESMIMGLETAVAAIQETESAVIHRFDELTESVSSSMMFSTNELNRARSKITDHLSRMKEDDEIQPLIPPIPKPKQPEAVKVKQKERGKAMTTRAVPVCISCQRCSRTIMLCQREQ